MSPAKQQTTKWLALLVVAVVVSNVGSTFSDPASGDNNACAKIATAYAEWSANQGECWLAKNKYLAESDGR